MSETESVPSPATMISNWSRVAVTDDTAQSYRAVSRTSGWMSPGRHKSPPPKSVSEPVPPSSVSLPPPPTI